MTDTLLSAAGVCLKKKGKTILQDVTLTIHAAEITTLIGPNGAGKTSLVRLLLGLDQPDSGVITAKPDMRIGYVPQSVVIPHELPLRVCDFLQLSGRIDREQIVQTLQELEIDRLCDTAMQSISGGELQRVLLARALLKKPQILVLDEPAQGLDVIGQQALYRMIAAIRDKHQCAVLMVSHDLHLVMAATDKVICLNSHVCCTGHPDDVSAHPEYIKLFGPALDGLAVYAHHHDHEHDMHGNIIGTGHEQGDHSGCSHD
jgi:zinc transport system ATP-binding protein